MRWRAIPRAVWLAIVLAALLAAAAFQYHSRNSATTQQDQAAELSYPQARAYLAKRGAARFGKADTLVIGDSLVHQTDLEGACGKTFAAGMAGARVAEPLSVVDDLLASLDPDLVVVGLGTNYFLPYDAQPRLEAELPTLLDRLGDRPLVIVGITYSTNGNAFLHALADERGAVFVQPPPGPMESDGYHYTDEGTRHYRAAIAAGCSKVNAKTD